MKKIIFLLNIDNYAPEITAITYPLIERYAQKIGASIIQITERKFPDFPPVYEKFQIYELAKANPADWYIYIDSDALLHPDLFDITAVIDKDTIFQVGTDFSPVRFKPNKYMLRDKRWIGTCNWFTVFSDLCIDLFNPEIGMSKQEIIEHSFVTNTEHFIFDNKHLIDDYILATNVARYGLKRKDWTTLMKEVGYPEYDQFFYHEYLIPTDEKIIRLKEKAYQWTELDYPAIQLANIRHEREQKDKITDEKQ